MKLLEDSVAEPDLEAAPIGTESEVHMEFANMYRDWMWVASSAAFRVLACTHAAESAAHDVFLRLWRRGPVAWREIRRPQAFFALAGRREALRRTRRQDTSRFMPMDDSIISHEPTPADEAELAEIRKAVAVSLARLPRRCGRIMELVYVRGWTQHRVAQELGIGSKAVEKQVARGRRRLREDAVLQALSCDCPSIRGYSAYIY